MLCAVFTHIRLWLENRLYGRHELVWEKTTLRRCKTTSVYAAAHQCHIHMYSQFEVSVRYSRNWESHIHCPPHTHPMMCINKHIFFSYMYTHLRFFLEIALRWYSYDSFMFSIFSLTMITAYEYELSEILLYK